jgi:hypothetical protein
LATLEKQQAVAKGKSSAKPAASGRSVTVAGMDVPVAQLPAAAIPTSRTPVRDADTFLDLQQAAPRVNNAPLDPKLKGFIPIPDTDTVFKIGGSARLDAIMDLSNNGNPNQFVPSTIPFVASPTGMAASVARCTQKARGLSLELRRPVPWDSTLRIYTEYDFFDDSTSSAMKFRARHFYGQAWNFLIGQTFSAFMDVDAFPDVVDYQGPNGIVNRRQPQIRYTLPIYDGASRCSSSQASSSRSRRSTRTPMNLPMMPRRLVTRPTASRVSVGKASSATCKVQPSSGSSRLKLTMVRVKTLSAGA